MIVLYFIGAYLYLSIIITVAYEMYLLSRHQEMTWRDRWTAFARWPLSVIQLFK